MGFFDFIGDIIGGVVDAVTDIVPFGNSAQGLFQGVTGVFGVGGGQNTPGLPAEPTLITQFPSNWLAWTYNEKKTWVDANRDNMHSGLIQSFESLQDPNIPIVCPAGSTLVAGKGCVFDEGEANAGDVVPGTEGFLAGFSLPKLSPILLIVLAVAAFLIFKKKK